MIKQIKQQSMRRYGILCVAVMLGLLTILWGPGHSAKASSPAFYGPEDPIGESTLGDFVWHDVDLDGLFDVGEEGINNVLVRLYLDDGDGVFEPGGDDQLLNSMLTGDNPNTVEIEQGWYTFDVDFGPTIFHWVEIPASNFGAGQPLENYALTTENTIGANPMYVIEGQFVADRTDIDFGFARTGITLQKTVYLGNNSGAGCPGGELAIGANSASVTYCFRVTNTGSFYLSDVTVVDDDLGITQANMTLLSGSLPLAPSASLVYYYVTTIQGDLNNTATASGNPTDANGVDLPGLQNPSATDTARVDQVAPAITLAKTVYVGHNGGAGCPGGELATGGANTPVTYCFSVTNTGDTYLSTIQLTDSTLSINQSNMTIKSGAAPLAPGASIVYYYEATISSTLINTATVSANPTNQAGDDLPGLNNPSATDTARVIKAAPAIALSKTVYAGHDGGAGCPGVELATGANPADVTFCFVVQNTGDTYLDNISVSDGALGITKADLTLLSGSTPLAPNGKLVYYYEANINQDIVNEATASGNPTDQNGVDIPGLANPSAKDTAEVDVSGPGIQLDKGVYLGHDSGASCPGDIAVTGANGDNITYCFVITNVGDTYLGSITVVDAPLGIDQADMTLLSGTTPLAPGAKLVYYYETTITGNLQNTATTKGAPTDQNGVVLPNLPEPSDDDTARVSQELGSISGHVWYDRNKNGQVDNGETPLPNVVIRLSNGLTTTTDIDGFFIFENLPDGVYSVNETDPTGYISISDADGGTDNVISGIRITNGNHVVDQDFFDARQLAKITGHVFEDVNRNGVIDPGERIYAGVTVELSNGMSTTTDENGYFEFLDVEPGDYTLNVIGPNGVLNTTPINVSTDLAEGETANVDFGFAPIMSLGNRVWSDTGEGAFYNNGVFDIGEQGISGVVLNLLNSDLTPVLDAGGAPRVETTDSLGYYLFDNLLPGEYVVQVAPSNFQAGGALFGLVSSQPTEANPNADADNNDHGIDDASPQVNGIYTGVIILAIESEVRGEPDQGDTRGGFAADVNSNLTADLGFIVPIEEGPKLVVLESFTAVQQGNSIAVSWITSAEIDTLGFHIYRGLNETFEGAVQLTTSTITAKGPQGGTYGTVIPYDPAVDPAVEQMYIWLVEIEVEGKENQYGPIRVTGDPTTSVKEFHFMLPLVMR
ncbi:MAG: SdrD B-like domain-containing protein [Caldilineaceae bacterium]